MSGSLERQVLSQLIADRGQQIERDAARRHGHQVGVSVPEILQSPRFQPAFRFGRIVEITMQLIDLHT